MHLIRFIDNRFQELRLKEQEESTKAEYSLTRDAEALALQSVLKTYRSAVKWLMIPKVLGHFAFVLFGLTKEPKAVITEKMKEARDKDLMAKAKKVGMSQKLDLVSNETGPSTA